MVNGQSRLPPPADIVPFSPQSPKAATIGHREPLDVLNRSWALQGSDGQTGVMCPSLNPGAGAAPGNQEVEARVSFKDHQGPLAEDIK